MLNNYCREKESEVEKLTAYSLDLEGKIQKLLTDFSTFRNKAQQMLSAKDEELDKLRGRGMPDSPSKK